MHELHQRSVILMTVAITIDTPFTIIKSDIEVYLLYNNFGDIRTRTVVGLEIPLIADDN